MTAPAGDPASVPLLAGGGGAGGRPASQVRVLRGRPSQQQQHSSQEQQDADIGLVAEDADGTAVVGVAASGAETTVLLTGDEDEHGTLAGDTQGGIFRLRPSILTLLPVTLTYNMATMLVSVLLPNIMANWFKCEPDGEGGHVLGAERILLLAAGGNHSKCHPYEAAQAVNGLVDSLRNLLAFFSAAFIGRLSDVVGRRVCIVAYLVIASLPTLALLLTGGESAAAYYATCLLCGLFGVGASMGFFGVILNAYIGDTYAAGERGTQFGRIAAVGTLAMIINPWFGKLTDGMTLVGVCCASLAMVCFTLVYVLLLMPESLPRAKRNRFSWGRTLNPLAPLRLLSQSRVMRWVALVAFLGDCASAGVREIAIMYTDQVLGLKGDAARDYNRLLFAVIGVCFLLNNIVVLPALLRLNTRASVLIFLGQIGNAVHDLVYVVLAYMPYKWVSLANSVPTGFTALSAVAATSLISANMGAKEQGFALGTLAAMQGIADIIAPLVYSETFAYFGHRFDMPQVPFGLGVLCALASALVALCGPLREIETRKRHALATSHSVAYRSRGRRDSECTVDSILGDSPIRQVSSEEQRARAEDAQAAQAEARR
jgi:DHA1 family tetracycline resistance protein-like MFS transporter